MPRVKRDPFGEWECEGCGATVHLFVNTAERAYYTCNGRMDGRMCGHNAVFGYNRTKQLLEELRHVEKETAPAGQQPDSAGDAGSAPASPVATTGATRGVLSGLRAYVRS
jgi:hypothetical protein